MFNRNTNELVVSNIGDAACFICRDNVVEKMIYEHKPTNKEEVERIEKAGLRVINDRINGIIAVSRSFGDKEFKAVSQKTQEEQPISCIPYISRTTLTEKDTFIVLCCGKILFYIFNFFNFFTIFYNLFRRNY